jgi:hypothetical protein
MADETSTRINEPTPNGGAYSIAYWKDADGNPTTKDKAVAVEIHELDRQDQSIFRTYATAKPLMP